MYWVVHNKYKSVLYLLHFVINIRHMGVLESVFPRVYNGPFLIWGSWFSRQIESEVRRVSNVNRYTWIGLSLWDTLCLIQYLLKTALVHSVFGQIKYMIVFYTIGDMPIATFAVITSILALAVAS